MKKWVAVMLLAGMCLPLLAEQTYTPQFDLGQILRQATMNSLPKKPELHKTGVVPVSLTVDMELGDKKASVVRFIIGCAAIKIAPDYLLASLTCKGQNKQIINYHMLPHDLTAYQTTTPINKRTLINVQVDDETITTFTQNEEERLLLIKLTPKAQEKLQSWPEVPLAFFEQTQSVLDKFNQFFVNRRFIVGHKRTFSEVEVEKACKNSFCVRVSRSLALKTGDPLFGIPAENPYQEFLLGFNSTQPNGDTLQSGDLYQVLSMKSKDFLQTNMKKSWESTSKRALLVPASSR